MKTKLFKTEDFFDSEMQFKCGGTKCSKGTKAYVDGNKEAIYVCDDFWTCGLYDTVITHEATHIAADTNDKGGYLDNHHGKFPQYEYDIISILGIPISEIGEISQSTSINNADTYAFFMRALNICKRKK